MHSCARLTRTPGSSRSTPRRRRLPKGVLRDLTPATISPRPRSDGLPCGWLITDVNGQPMKEPPHPVPRAGQGALRRRPRRRGGRRDAAAGARRGGAGRKSTTRSCLPSVRRGRSAQKGAPVLHDAAPDNTCYVWALGDKAAVDEAFAKARTRHHARIRQQPADPQRDRAARARTRAIRAPTTATRSTSRARIRTSSAC